MGEKIQIVSRASIYFSVDFYIHITFIVIVFRFFDSPFCGGSGVATIKGTTLSPAVFLFIHGGR